MSDESRGGERSNGGPDQPVDPGNGKSGQSAFRTFISRREFLKGSAVGAGAIGAGAIISRLAFLEPVSDNPLVHYPNRDFEQYYRNIYQTDGSFVFQCAPNDTHNCLLQAFTRKGVITRIEPTYRYGEATDLYGNRASERWGPRCCQNGLSLTSRFYDDRRVKGAMVRKGFLDWADAGFPRDENSGRPDPEYFRRGKDEWEQVTFDRAYRLLAEAQLNIARTYSGGEGVQRLERQEYDPAMIEATGGAGVRTLKVRGGMPLLGPTRVYGLYRYANMLALLDQNIRGVDEDNARGATHWDSYSWHTDLPPGHPLVTGNQTVDCDLFNAENADLIQVWGMNWITTKMPEAHWLTEARMRGTKVVIMSVEYQPAANKADELVILRPGTDCALALGMAHVMMREQLWDDAYVKSFTDLPLLVRLDTGKLLKGADIEADYEPATLERTRVLRDGESPDPITMQEHQYVGEEMRRQWGDAVVWDQATGAPRIINRDEVGEYYERMGIDAALSGSFTVTTVDGETVEVRPVFDLIREYLEEFHPRNVAEITGVPVHAVEHLARDMAEHSGHTYLVHGMGPNHFFNADLKDRAFFLIASLTGNIGKMSGTLGSYAGNYRLAMLNGVPQYSTENPFAAQTDENGEVSTRNYARLESAHYYNYGDRPLRVNGHLFMGSGHMPVPTKSMWFANGNSILGNAKWSYDLMHNTLPKIECIAVNEWWWTWSCEYADIVFGVDSWAEMNQPDITASVTNPFVTMFPRTPHQRLYDTRGDIEVLAGVAKALGDAVGDRRFEEYWHFVHENRVDVYLQRIIDGSSTLKGYDVRDLEAKAARGIPSLMMMRTYPKIVGWEQTQESKPWYTKSGRCEFYRDEDEYLEYGENLPIYREPVDGTHYMPNLVIGRPHPVLRPKPPQEYGIDATDTGSETLQVRNIMLPWSEVRETKHPLSEEDDGYRFVFHTPKYRHGAHTTSVDVEWISLIFGPFTDPHRRDKRMPWVGEGYADMNPVDARELGIADGDYIWIDANPGDRPYRGYSGDGDSDDAKVSRMMARARYYSGTPRGVVRMWFNMFQASHGSVEGHETREDGLARNPRTGYKAMFRYGGHQSATRAWLRPTLLTDSLARKDAFGQMIGQGFAADIHCANGAPKESFVRIRKAEPGGIGGEGVWRWVEAGVRPGTESDDFKRYLHGEYTTFS